MPEERSPSSFYKTCESMVVHEDLQKYCNKWDTLTRPQNCTFPVKRKKYFKSTHNKDNCAYVKFLLLTSTVNILYHACHLKDDKRR